MHDFTQYVGKMLAFVFLVTIAFQVSFGENGEIIHDTHEDDDGDHFRSYCSSSFICKDCSTAQVCGPTASGLLMPVFTFTCPTNRPHCNALSGTCSVSPDLHCGEVNDTFLCSDDGIFPDGNDCGKYHKCENYVPNLFKCSDNQVYNADTEKCEEKTEKNCLKADCTNSRELKRSLGSTHYYSYCADGKSQIVVRCPGQYKLNEDTQLCDASCFFEGPMQNINNCSQYFKCSKNPNKPTQFIRETLTCPYGQGYDVNYFTCVSKEHIGCV